MFHRCQKGDKSLSKLITIQLPENYIMLWSGNAYEANGNIPLCKIQLAKSTFIHRILLSTLSRWPWLAPTGIFRAAVCVHARKNSRPKRKGTRFIRAVFQVHVCLTPNRSLFFNTPCCLMRWWQFRQIIHKFEWLITLFDNHSICWISEAPHGSNCQDTCSTCTLKHVSGTCLCTLPFFWHGLFQFMIQGLILYIFRIYYNKAHY